MPASRRRPRSVEVERSSHSHITSSEATHSSCPSLSVTPTPLSARTFHVWRRRVAHRPLHRRGDKSTHSATASPHLATSTTYGEETQWDWVDPPNPPASWGRGAAAHLLVGSLAHSGRWYGVLAPAMTQAHLVDRVSRRLGGLTRTWRYDRKATVCHSDFVGSRPASPASPNATAPRWRFAHRGPETAQEWRRRPIPLLPSAGGAPCPTISPSNEPSRGWMSSVVCGATPGCLPPRTEG